MHLRRHLPALALYVVVFLVCLATAATSSACAGNQRQRALRAAVVSVNTARDGFLVWDKQHQIRIVEGATSREDGQQKLDAYRARRVDVVTAFEGAYKALALAATHDDDPSYRDALRAAQSVAKTVLDLTGGP